MFFIAYWPAWAIDVYVTITEIHEPLGVKLITEDEINAIHIFFVVLISYSLWSNNVMWRQ